MQIMVRRRLPIGAEVSPDGVHFRVWAPRRKRVEVIFEEGRTLPLESEADGYFQALDERSEPGMLYRFRVDGLAQLLPDPASRFQPQGPHGPSQIVDPSTFQWTDGDWRG